MAKPFSLLILFFVFSCSGYQLGSNKPSHLKKVKSIYIPLFKNDTLVSRAESQATRATINSLLKDGTYSLARLENADATLYGTIKSIKFTQISASRLDTLRSEELRMELVFDWSLVDTLNPRKILQQGEAYGRSQLYAQDNINTAITNALPDALERASKSLVSQIAHGF